MSQVTEMKRELREAKKLRLSWLQRLAIIAVVSPATFLFALYGQLQLVWPLIISVGMPWLVVWLKWDLRHHAWFWVTIAFIGIFNVSLLLLVHWPATWMPAALMTGISTLDFLLVLWFVVFVERATAKRAQHRRS